MVIPAPVAFACAFLIYAALTIVLTFPLVLHLGSTMPHDLGDPLMSTAILWWNAHVMPLTSRWWAGFAFFPAPGQLAFSDHRLGLSLIASPLQWLGVGVVAAHNLTFLLTFPLSAIAAHTLAFTLTRRHDAAALCGLAYGFNPFRTLHSAHLELQAAYGMPLALAALHVFVRTRRPSWLGPFALALVLQGLCSSYYLMFFGVLLALWIAWFAPWRDWKSMVLMGGVCAAAAVALSPIMIGFARIHSYYGLSRAYFEVVAFSGDLSSLATASPLLALWGWTSRLNEGERQLFPGLTIALLAVSGLFLTRRAHPTHLAYPAHLTHPAYPTHWRPVAAALLGLSIGLTSLALFARLHGPARIAFAGLTISLRVFYKPLSLAILALLCALAIHPRMRRAYRERSPYAFYLMAAAVLFVCSFGPQPRFLGEQFLYEAPYRWLMSLPVFSGGLRVPARFAMPAVLGLSVAGSLAFDRVSQPRRRRILCFLAAAGIMADSWIRGLPLPAVPKMWPAARAAGFAAVAELPIGDTAADAAAMYRATLHGRPVVNAISGYDPPHYRILRLALAERDPTALQALTEHGPLLLVVDKREAPQWAAFARADLQAEPVGQDDRWAFFKLARRDRPDQDRSEDRGWRDHDTEDSPASIHEIPGTCDASLGIVAVRDDRGQTIDVRHLTDHDPSTFWATAHPQHVGDALVLDLGRSARPCLVELSLGGGAELYPRALSVQTSPDGVRWTPRFAGRMGGAALRGALERPRDIRIRVPLREPDHEPGEPSREAASHVRYIRVRLEESQALYPWMVTDVLVLGAHD